MSDEPQLSATPEVAAELRALRSDVDQLLLHLVPRLKRLDAFEELSARLADAERRLSTRQERPLVAGLVTILTRVRNLNFDPAVKASLEDELARLLTGAGYKETGERGESFDPDRHEAIGGTTVDGQGVVGEVHARGLSCLGEVVVKAKVCVVPPGVPPASPPSASSEEVNS